MASLNVGGLGEYLREQRRSAQLSLRQLADAAGVSNPYLSQIERGLRKPSAEILQQLAKALRISAETLYVQAGILDEREREREGLEVRAAIIADPLITERQKQVLLQIYESFRKETAKETAHDSAHGVAHGVAHDMAHDIAKETAGERGGEDAGEPVTAPEAARSRGGAAKQAAKKAAARAAAKVADVVADAVAETVGSRARALKTVPPRDDDKGGTEKKPRGEEAAERADAAEA